MPRARLAGLALALFALSACGQQSGSPGATTAAAERTPLPDLARVVCRPGQPPRIETPAVKPQPDGVHLELVNETEQELTFSIEDPSGGGMGAGAPRGTSTHVADVDPGRMTLACYDPLTEDGGEGETTPLEVVDEDGVWVSTRLDCRKQFSSVIDYALNATGETSDPVEAARTALEAYSLEPDDVVEPAGYPEADVRQVRLVSGGETLAVVQLIDDGAGRWLVGGVTGCSRDRASRPPAPP